MLLSCAHQILSCVRNIFLLFADVALGTPYVPEHLVDMVFFFSNCFSLQKQLKCHLLYFGRGENYGLSFFEKQFQNEENLRTRDDKR